MFSGCGPPYARCQYNDYQVRASEYREFKVEDVVHQLMASQGRPVSTQMRSSREFAGLGGKGVLANHVGIRMCRRYTDMYMELKNR